MMRNAARRGDHLPLPDIRSRSPAATGPRIPAGVEDDADDGDGAMARWRRFGAHIPAAMRARPASSAFTNSTAIPAAISHFDVRVTREGRGNFRVTGKVTRYQSRPDNFTCRVAHGEVIGFACTILTSRGRQSARRCSARCCSAQPRPCRR
jgi:hypothetical protein